MEIFPGLPNDVGVECLIRVSYGDFPSVMSVCRQWKYQIGQEEFWSRRKALNLTGKVVVMAQARVHSVDEHGIRKHKAAPGYRPALWEPKTGRWTELPGIPGKRDGQLPMFCHLAGIKQNLVVVGGWNTTTWEVSDSVYIYDFITAKWRQGASMPGCRRSFFACASDSQRFVFVAGGHDDEKSAFKSALAYDVIKDLWVPLPDMEKERDESSGVYHQGKFHVVGGYQTNMQGRFERSAEVFDVASWQWGSVEENYLNHAICLRNCLVTLNGKVFTLSCFNEVVALRGLAWHVVAELPANLRNTSCMVAFGDKIMVTGSESER